MKRMLINATQKEELRVALVDGQRLYDLDIETVSAKQKKANIYKGKITRVEPSLEAAFVDYGAERHGFLPIKEIAKTYFSGSTAVGNNGKPDYKKLIREGQEVMVQVEKEERGNKGAALTTYIGLAGRYLVCMPNNPRGGGVSRRVQGSERRELRDALDKVNVPDDVGVIVRTAGVGRNHEELQWDLDYQMQVWQAISDAYEQSPVGALLYQESNIIVRALRDYFRDDIAQIIIDDEAIYQRAHGFMSLVMPDKLKCLQLYRDELPLFTRYQIEAQIDSAYGRNVRLPSGGELVIDYTEAMVSIDINSARSTKGGDVEETALHTNLEAAEEVARQLRLRDIGGLIVVDFIDMYEAKHRRQVEEKIRDAIRIDRARVQLARISKFGLLEMSRQRLRPSIDEASHKVCPRCKGQGSIRSTQSVALSVLRLIEEDANKDTTAKVMVQLPMKVATYLLNEKRQAIAEIERNNNVNVLLIANDSLQTPNFDIQRIRHDDDSIDGIVSYKLVRDFNAEDADDDNSQQKDSHATQEAVVADIEPPALPPQPKLGFFKMIKRVLGIGDSDAGENDKEAPKKHARPTTNHQKNGQDNQRKRNNNTNNRRRRKAFDNDSSDKSEQSSQPSNQSVNKKAPRKSNETADNNEATANKLNTDNRRNDKPKKADKSEHTQSNKRKGQKTAEKTEKTSNKPKADKANKAPAKPFVNEFATDQSKVHAGRPVSEDAVRGAGKADYQALTAETNSVASSTGTTPDSKTETKQKTNHNNSHKDKSKAKSERVYVPRAVGDAVPALNMSDATVMPEVQEATPEQSTQGEKATEIQKVSEVAPKKANKQGNPIAELSAFGQSVWYDNISRDMIESGELQRLIAEDDLRGITSNPAIFEKALASNHPSYLAYLQALDGRVDSAKAAFFALAIKDIREACDAMLPTYKKTDGTDGMVSLEVSPDIAYDAEKTIEEALILQQKLDKPNAMIKVPGTEQGLIALEQLTYLGLNINVTLLFSVERYVAVFEAYMRGLQKRAEMGLPVSHIRSVASFFISRIDNAADAILADTQPALKGSVAIANAKVAYDAYLQLLDSEQWQRLQLVGAQPQRLLWASTSTKDPSYRDVLYVEALIGQDTVNTVPPATYDAFKDHGEIAETITQGVAEAKSLIAGLPEYKVDLPGITDKLERDGVAAFEKSFDGLLKVLNEKMMAKETTNADKQADES